MYCIHVSKSAGLGAHAEFLCRTGSRELAFTPYREKCVEEVTVIFAWGIVKLDSPVHCENADHLMFVTLSPISTPMLVTV